MKRVRKNRISYGVHGPGNTKPDKLATMHGKHGKTVYNYELSQEWKHTHKRCTGPYAPPPELAYEETPLSDRTHKQLP